MTPIRGRGAAPNGDQPGNGDHEYADHDYSAWDAAYVLGSLTANDRREFEAHMGGCASCRDAVSKLSGMPAVLALLDRDEVAAIDEGDHVWGVPPLRAELLTPSLLDRFGPRRRGVS